MSPEPPPPQRPPRRERRWEPDDDRENPFRRREGEEVVSSLIPYKNGLALASYYCGVFALIPVLGLLLGPLALVFGILGFRNARIHPQAKGMVHAIVGIVLGLFTMLLNCVPILFLLWRIITGTVK